MSTDALILYLHLYHVIKPEFLLHIKLSSFDVLRRRAAEEFGGTSSRPFLVRCIIM